MSTLPAIPGYRVQKRLGSGGNGTVYLAESETLHRLEAIKLLHADLPAAVGEHLLLEAQRMARIVHPLVVRVYSFGAVLLQGRRRDSIAMEYFEGLPLLEGEAKERLLQQSFCRRMDHFRELCEAINYLHSRGIVHGDLTPANVMYAPGADRIKIVDFGMRPRLDDGLTDEEWLARDVKALSAIFLQYFCVPLISTYRDRLMESTRSVEDILCCLQNVRRAGPPPPGRGPDADGGVRRQAYAADALARYDEMLMRFCCSFGMGTRIVFGTLDDLDRPYDISIDHARRRAHVYVHPLLAHTSADQVIVLDAIARIFIRDATIGFGAWLRRTARSVEEPLPRNAGFSNVPSAAEGLGAEAILEGFASILQSENALRPEELDETARRELHTVAILQLLQAGVLYNRLRRMVADGQFGELATTAASSRMLAGWSRRDLLGGMFVQTLADLDAELGLGISDEQKRVLAYVLESVPNPRLADRRATRNLLEHVLWTLLPEPLLSLDVDEGFVLEPARVLLVGDDAGSFHWSDGYLHVLGHQPAQSLSIPFSRDDLVTLRALMEFETIVRMPVTQTFTLDRLAIHGRRGIGNVLVIGPHYIKPGEQGWEELSLLAGMPYEEEQRRSFTAKMQRLLAQYEAGLALDAKEGRLFVNPGSAVANYAALQSAGIVPVMNFTERPAHVFLDEWMRDRVADAVERVRSITNP